MKKSPAKESKRKIEMLPGNVARRHLRILIQFESKKLSAIDTKSKQSDQQKLKKVKNTNFLLKC